MKAVQVIMRYTGASCKFIRYSALIGPFDIVPDFSTFYFDKTFALFRFHPSILPPFPINTIIQPIYVRVGLTAGVKRDYNRLDKYLIERNKFYG
jgi:hypothetical protein